MTKILPLALHAACAATFAMMATGATAQTPPPGRTAFDQHGCRTCHAYSSRRGAPSVRDMLATFEGEPENALQGIEKTARHSSDPAVSAASEADRRSIAEWIAGTSFAEPEAEATPAPAVAPVAVPPPMAAPVLAAPAVTPATAKPAAAPSRPATGSLVGLVIEPGKKTDRLIITLTGKNPDDLDISSIDGKLLVRLPGVSRAASVPANIAASKTTRAVNTVQAIEEDGTLTVTIAPRSGDLKYAATQGRNRLTIELSTVPSKKRPAPAVLAAAPIAAAPVAAAAAAKALAVPKPTTDKTRPAGKTISEKPVAAKPEVAEKPAVVAKLSPAEDGKARQEAKAKQEAEAKARAEAQAQALAKKEADEKVAQAAKKEIDDKAKREGSAASKAEADMLASLTASAEALKKGSDGEGKSGRRDRSKMKAPDKFRDEPCPPIGESDPIGTVDETKAKDIIDRVGCPQCHAFVQKKTGPPFKRVFEKVKGNPSCVVARLKKNKEHREEGVTDDLKGQEFKIVADYLATRAK